MEHKNNKQLNVHLQSISSHNIISGLVQTQRVLRRLLLSSNTLHTTLDTLSSALGSVPKTLCCARNSLSEATCSPSHSVSQATDRVAHSVRDASDCLADGITQSAEETSA